MDKRMYWRNRKTGETEFRDMPETDEEAVKYIPQDETAQGLYVCWRNLGLEIDEAMINVLSASVGKTPPFKAKN